MLSVSYSHADKNIKQAAGHMGLEFRRKVYTEGINLGALTQRYYSKP